MRSSLVLGALLALAGCGTVGPATPVAGPTAGPTADYSTVDSEYRGIQFGLNLPPGVTFPAHLPASGTTYQANAGRVAAQNFWFCAWLRAYLAGDAGAATQVPKYTRMDAYTKALDGSGRSTVDGVIRGVATGTKAPVTTFVNASCGGPFNGAAHS
jgi:hypothetical protein